MVISVLYIFIFFFIFFFFFFFNDTATTEIYTLSLHDALPILVDVRRVPVDTEREGASLQLGPSARELLDEDRKSTRLNSSHSQISYAVFCLKKKKQKYSALFFNKKNNNYTSAA